MITDEALTVEIQISDVETAERIKAWLSLAPGLRLADPEEEVDLVITTSEPRPASATLTGREREVLALMAQGASNKAIALALGISVHTAKFHVGQLIDKLDATGRTDAVAHAARQGVIHL